MVLASLASMLGAAPALAADVGECGTPEAMTAKLRAEGQRSVAYADDLTIKDEYYSLMFTVNADQSVGYVLKSDRLANEQATRICIDRRLADVRLHDARRVGVPSAALLTAPETETSPRCEERHRRQAVRKEFCGSLNTLLRVASDQFGRRPMLQGIVVEKTAAGYRKTGDLLTLSGVMAGSNPDERGGDIKLSALPHGATAIVGILVGPTYTAHGQSLLR